MSEEVSNPLLSLVKEQGLVDDLQFEEVLAEFKRTGKQAFQILQDFGIMDSDAILQVISNHLGAPVVTINERELTPELIQSITPRTAHMYQCLPVAMENSTLQLALIDPLNVSRADEVGFITVKKDIQLVVADPTQRSKRPSKSFIPWRRRTSRTF